MAKPHKRRPQRNNPTGPYTWGNGPNARKGIPKTSGGDGCAVTALAMAGGLVTGVAGVAYLAAQALGASP